MVEDVMVKAGKDQDFDEMLSKIGPDATATFDNSPSNPTEHASSEATNAATAVNAAPAVDDDDEELEEDDDDAAALEEDDEIDEEEDVEDEAGV
jgi:ribosomal protein L12E/L44/L45/RPP1/RPP2